MENGKKNQKHHQQSVSFPTRCTSATSNCHLPFHEIQNASHITKHRDNLTLQRVWQETVINITITDISHPSTL